MNKSPLATTPELNELMMAHQIIRNMLNLMTTDQKSRLGIINDRMGISGEGVTRANEREDVIRTALADHKAQHARSA